MSSLLLQTEKTLSKTQPVASPAEVRKDQKKNEAKALVAAHMALTRNLLHGLGNASSTLQSVLDKLKGGPHYGDLNASLEDIVKVRDAIVLAIPSIAPDDMDRLAPVGVTLSKAAKDLFELRVSQAKDGLTSVLEVLDNVHLPAGEYVYESLESQEPTVPAESIYYGNWCGQFHPPGDCGPHKGCHIPPIDMLDMCCKDHVLGYGAAYPKLRCEKKAAPDDGDKPDCLLYVSHDCQKLASIDQTLATCATTATCPPYDSVCKGAQAKIITLYGASVGMYAAGESACPAIPRKA